MSKYQYNQVCDQSNPISGRTCHSRQEDFGAHVSRCIKMRINSGTLSEERPNSPPRIYGGRLSLSLHAAGGKSPATATWVAANCKRGVGRAWRMAPHPRATFRTCSAGGCEIVPSCWLLSAAYSSILSLSTGNMMLRGGKRD